MEGVPVEGGGSEEGLQVRNLEYKVYMFGKKCNNEVLRGARTNSCVCAKEHEI